MCENIYSKINLCPIPDEFNSDFDEIEENIELRFYSKATELQKIHADKFNWLFPKTERSDAIFPNDSAENIFYNEDFVRETIYTSQSSTNSYEIGEDEKLFISEEQNWKLPENYTLNEFPPSSPGQDGLVNFFFIDSYTSNNELFLFGKIYNESTDTYCSSCVSVNPFRKLIHVILRKIQSPSSSFSHDTVLNELYNRVLKPLNVDSFKCKFFRGKDIQNPETEADIMAVEYWGRWVNQVDFPECQTFSKVYGSKKTFLEQFLIQKKIKGPCWLQVPNNLRKAADFRTWCPLEFSCSLEQVRKLHNTVVPKLRILSLHLNVEKGTNKINFISWAYNGNYELGSEKLEFCGCMFYVEKIQYPKILKTFKRTRVFCGKSEDQLLDEFASIFLKMNPDIVVGFDFNSAEFKCLISKLQPKYFGRKLTKFRNSYGKLDAEEPFILRGRLLCDLKHSSRDFLAKTQVSILDLYRIILNKTYIDPKCDSESEQSAVDSVISSTNHALNLLEICYKSNVIQLALKITQICGNSLSETFKGSAMNRVEFLLLHALHKLKFVVNEKIFKTNFDDVQDLSGGLVLPARIGFYENYVLLMDFESLYPNLIKKYDFCITGTGILPRLIGNLLEKRKLYQNLSKKNESLSIFATALKLTANSIYGCLASKFFRFSSPKIAAEITAKGRETLSKTVEILTFRDIDIIYGDTDSIMINTRTNDLKKVEELSETIKNLISDEFGLIIKTDAIFSHLLLLAKKKYAGLVDGNIVIKGLDIIRGDWSKIARETGENTLKILLDTQLTEYEKQFEVSQLLETVKNEMESFPLDQFEITQFLSKDLEEYDMEKCLGSVHIKIALRCKQNSVCNLKKNDPVTFFICENGENNKPVGLHLLEFAKIPNARIHFAYYVEKQIFPIVFRLCAPFAGFDNMIRKSLQMTGKKSEETCEKLIVKGYGSHFHFECQSCRTLNRISEIQSDMEKCRKCEFQHFKNAGLVYLKNSIEISIQKFIRKYYNSRFVCNNSSCKLQTRNSLIAYDLVRENDEKMCLLCCSGNLIKEYDEIDLYAQLEYYKNIFACWKNRSFFNFETRNAYRELISVVEKFLENSNFNHVDLTKLFKNLNSKRLK